MFGGPHFFGAINPISYYFGSIMVSNNNGGDTESSGNNNDAGGGSDRARSSLTQTGSDPHHSSYQQVQSELAKMNSLIYSQQNNFFQLHLGSKEL